MTTLEVVAAMSGSRSKLMLPCSRLRWQVPELYSADCSEPGACHLFVSPCIHHFNMQCSVVLYMSELDFAAAAFSAQVRPVAVRSGCSEGAT